MKKVLGFIVVTSVISIIGCGDDPVIVSGSELTTRSTAISQDMTKEFLSAVKFLEEVSELDAVGNGFDVAGGIFGEEEETGPIMDPQGGDIGGNDPGDEEEDPIDPDQAARDLEDFLNDYILTAENLEEEGDNLAVYLLMGSVVCVDDFMSPIGECVSCSSNMDDYDGYCYDVDPTECDTQYQEDQAECIANVDEIQIRIRLTPDGNGIKAVFMIGPEKYEVLELVLGDEPLYASLSVSLGDIREAIVHISTVVDEDPIEMPEIMEGRLSIALQENGEQDFTLSNSIDEDVHLRVANDNGENIDIQAAKAAPLVSLQLKGLEKTAIFGVDLNEVLVNLPLSDIYNSATGKLIIDLAGLEGGIEISEAAEELTLKGFGLGSKQSSIKHDDTSIVAIDINPDADRHMDISVTAENELPLISIEPGLLLQLYVNLGHLDQYLEEDEDPAPKELSDQTYTFTMAGDNDLFQFTLVDTDTDDALKVVLGSLRIESDMVNTSFQADAGQCIMPLEACEENNPDLVNAIIECLEATTCPDSVIRP
jgi:hypothetical protein